MTQQPTPDVARVMMDMEAWGTQFSQDMMDRSVEHTNNRAKRIQVLLQLETTTFKDNRASPPLWRARRG